MINEKMSLKETFLNARSRLDGISALICIAASALVPLLFCAINYYGKGVINFNFPALLAPLVVLLFYIRLRQLDSNNGLLHQIINAVLIAGASTGLVYVLNFSSKGIL